MGRTSYDAARTTATAQEVFERALQVANVTAQAYFNETDPHLKTLRYAEWTAAARRLKWAGEDLREGREL